MSDLKIQGKLIKIFNTQEVSSSFKKREFVIETEEQYPQQIKFELTQAKCDDINAHKAGSQITVHFNVRGREYKGSYFNTLVCWRIEGVKKETTKPIDDSSASNDNFADDLPF